MRTLSDSLLAAQRGTSQTPYVGVNMVKAGQTTYTYTTTDATNRIWSIEHVESIWGSTARTIIRLQNADQYFSDHDFRGYKVYVWFGYSGEYSECAPQWVYDQREVSEEGILLTELYCVDIWWRLGRLKVVGGGVKLSGTITGTFQLAESITEKTDPGNVPTGVTALKLLAKSTDHIVVTGTTGMFTANNKAVGDVSAAEIAITDVSVGGAGAAPGWPGDTTILDIISSLLVDVADVVDDTGGGDAQLSTMPTYQCDRFDPILGVLRRMMEQTYSGLLFQNDDDVHLIYLDPAEAIEYNYDDLHAFFVDVRSRRLVIPNKVFVLDALPDNESAQYTYWGVADDTVSQAAIGIVTALFEDPAITTNEEAATKAAALLSRMQDETTQGTVIAPMNCGQELFDKISIADSRANLTLTGRVGIIRRVYNPPSANRLEHYSIECRIGGLTDIVDISSPQSMIDSLLTYGYGRLSVPGGAVSGPLFSPSVTIDASQVNFAPATLSKWTGSADPGQTDDALDQLADRTKTLEGATHAAVTLAVDAETLLGLTGQQLTLDTQAANLTLAGPTSGAAADPTFRSLVSADLPASVVETSDANYIDLTDGGATTLHSHAGAGAHDILSATHSDTLAGSVLDGDVVIGNVTPAWSRLAIAIPAASVRNVLGIDNAELRPSWKTALDATNPADIAAAASPGTSLVFAHRDHVHAHPDLGDLHTVYLLATGARAGSTSEAQSFGATGIKANVVAESGADAGVTVDGLLIKDGAVVGTHWQSTVLCHNESMGAVVHSNPGTAYTAWDTDGGGAYMSLLIPEGCTHARLIFTASGNEAGAAKGLRITVGGTNIDVEWAGSARTDKGSGWVAVATPPATPAQGMVSVKGSSATEDMIINWLGVAFKKVVA